MSSRRVERAARAADKDFDSNIEAYLAMYRPKVDQKPFTTRLERVIEVGLWAIGVATAISLTFSVVYNG